MLRRFRAQETSKEIEEAGKEMGGLEPANALEQERYSLRPVAARQALAAAKRMQTDIT